MKFFTMDPNFKIKKKKFWRGGGEGGDLVAGGGCSK